MTWKVGTAWRRMFAHLEPRPEGLIEGEEIFGGKPFRWVDGHFVPTSYNSRQKPSEDQDE